MATRPRLPALIPAVVLAVLVACQRDKESPTATASVAVPSEANFSEQSSLGDASNGKPHVEDVAASVVFSHVKGRLRDCVGDDGQPYEEAEHTFTGTSAGDPRLSGDIEVKNTDFISLATFAGPQVGTVVIRDAATGSEKARGDYTAWGTAFGDFVQGTVLGTVRAANGGRLVAGWTISYRADGVFGEFDGAPRGQVPAGIYTGHCTGKWTYYENDIPFTGGAATAAANVRRPRG